MTMTACMLAIILQSVFQKYIRMIGIYWRKFRKNYRCFPRLFYFILYCRRVSRPFFNRIFAIHQEMFVSNLCVSFATVSLRLLRFTRFTSWGFLLKVSIYKLYMSVNLVLNFSKKKKKHDIYGKTSLTNYFISQMFKGIIAEHMFK